MSAHRYEEIDTSRDLKEISNEILDYWRMKKIPDISLKNPLGTKDFVFLEGPPTANGKPHVGNLMTRVVKDAILRYRYITGHKIYRRTGGWDCHGLPVEVEAEKHFNFKTKKDIENYGVAKFNDYCRKSVFAYITDWAESDDRIGFWVDHENAYVTMKRDYIESEWWALKKLFDSGLLYRDYKIVPYCPRCETSLSSHEVSLGYAEAKDPSVYVKFHETGKGNVYFLAWTTTPWTLPSNEFLCVNPDIDYSLVKYGDDEYYVASAAIPRIFKNPVEVVESFKGSELVGKRYDQLLNFIPAPEGTMVVTSGSHVNVEEGTGIVHTAPAFGAEDFDIGKKMHVEMINPVDQSGKFSDGRLPWFGRFVKDADTDIIILLKSEKKLLRSEKIEHTYPFCYRCGTPLLYYPLTAWFIRVSSLKEKLIENNQLVNWMPDYIKNGRFGNFLLDVKDWALSRNRYWGTPLPIWSCQNGHLKAIGSTEELKNHGAVVPDDLHRPFIDEVTFKCEECGEIMTREPYVIDTWFDSGSSTYAALHYPFESKSADLKIPITFIIEAIDQTRGWFYTLHVISTMLFGINAYSNVMSIDFVLDEQGRKMSKSKGNVVFALDMINDYGPDACRLFFLRGVPWKTRVIDKKYINDSARRIMGTLSNVYSFFASNANLDNYSYEGLLLPENALDRWIVSRVNSSLREYLKVMDRYEPFSAINEIERLIDELSNFYLRLSRRRFWASELPEEKNRAYSVLFYSLDRIIRMLSPITPFFSDYIFLKMHPGSESVHLELLPEVQEELINGELEEQVGLVMSMVELVRRLRQENSIKGRQPISEILLYSETPIDPKMIDMVVTEVNAKEIRMISKIERPVSTFLQLKFKEAAPVLKGKLNSVKNAVENASSAMIDDFVNNGKLVLDGMELSNEFVDIVEKPADNFVSAKDSKSGIEVFLNTHIDRNLMLEGLAREIIRRIQVMRKDNGLRYDQRIDLKVWGTETILEAVKAHNEWIKAETLTNRLETEDNKGSKAWDIDGETLLISLKAL